MVIHLPPTFISSVAYPFIPCPGTSGLQGPAGTLGAISILAAIVTVHECGHFLAARSQGIHVSKFSIGFGPALLTYQGPVVEYSLRLIPLGGYVAFPDDTTGSESGEAEGAARGEEPEGRKETVYSPDDPDLLQVRQNPSCSSDHSCACMNRFPWLALADSARCSPMSKCPPQGRSPRP